MKRLWYHLFPVRYYKRRKYGLWVGLRLLRCKLFHSMRKKIVTAELIDDYCVLIKECPVCHFAEAVYTYTPSIHRVGF